MQRTPRQPWPRLCAFVMLLCLLAGCATRTPTVEPVGAVVVAPQKKLEPINQKVQQVKPKPAGYFQRRLRLYSEQPSSKPTTSTTPTPAAEPKP